MKTKLIALYFSCVVGLISACSSIMGAPTSGDPTERGLSYVAGAIVLASLIRACPR